jgi:(p)ppGpp synthase/HD superfamily hydrolase
MNSIYEAITYATKMHEGEYRKKTDIPYIVHPFSAMYSLKDCGIEDQNILIATLQLYSSRNVWL